LVLHGGAHADDRQLFAGRGDRALDDVGGRARRRRRSERGDPASRQERARAQADLDGVAAGEEKLGGGGGGAPRKEPPMPDRRAFNCCCATLVSQRGLRTAVKWDQSRIVTPETGRVA